MDRDSKQRKNFSINWRPGKTFIIITSVVVILGAGTGAYLLKTSEQPAFCANCHIIEPYYQSWYDSDLLAARHAEADLVCHDCHQTSINSYST